MRIAVGTLSLAFTVFLNFFESIISKPKTLKELFPDFNGVMRPLKEFRYEGQFSNLKEFDHKNILFHEETFLRRDHVIFGWKRGNFIRNPGGLFVTTRPPFIVFDMNKDEWFTVSRDASWKLGAGRYFPLVVARDEADDGHKLTSNHPAYKEAHFKACREANDQVDIVEREQVQLLSRRETTIGDIITKIKEEYSQTYDRAFSRHLHQHGEYNIDGYRAWNT